jgi:hypothetical protein
MPSNLITPPDMMFTDDCVFILNMIETEVEFLFDYLKTCPREHNIHLYHSDMSQHHDYAVYLALAAPNLLVSHTYEKLLSEDIRAVIEQRLRNNQSSVIYFGSNTKFPNPVDWFISKYERLLKV